MLTVFQLQFVGKWLAGYFKSKSRGLGSVSVFCVECSRQSDGGHLAPDHQYASVSLLLVKKHFACRYVDTYVCCCTQLEVNVLGRFHFAHKVLQIKTFSFTFRV